MIFFKEVLPDLIEIALKGILNFVERVFSRAQFASPFSLGAFTLTMRNPPSCLKTPSSLA